MDRTGASEGQYSKISKMYIPYVAGGTIYLKNEDGSFSATHDGWGEYRTTKEFLRVFHLGSLDELPEMPGLEADGQLRIEADGAIGDPLRQAAGDADGEA